MKKGLIIIILSSSIASFLTYFATIKKANKSNLINQTPKIEKTLEKYSIENLSKADIKSGEIIVKEKIEEKDKFNSYIFEFKYNPNLDGKTIKTTTGMINIPKGEEKFPLVIMIRGYVDPTIYKTGIGSKNLSYFLAENGFLTIAPDFLGYANSDKEANDIFESRFQTYTTILSLIKSAEKIEKWDKKNIFIWGHSNGGQISLYVLETINQEIPTVLWAPVSKPFPYSILYYTDETEDKGKFIRKELAKFEEIYNVEDFSITNHFNRINSKILIIQGTSDDAVPEKWSRELYQTLQKMGKNINYKTYPGDHNLRQSWQKAAKDTLVFFKDNLTN